MRCWQVIIIGTWGVEAAQDVLDFRTARFSARFRCGCVRIKSLSDNPIISGKNSCRSKLGGQIIDDGLDDRFRPRRLTQHGVGVKGEDADAQQLAILQIG